MTSVLVMCLDESLDLQTLEPVEKLFCILVEEEQSMERKQQLLQLTLGCDFVLFISTPVRQCPVMPFSPNQVQKPSKLSMTSRMVMELTAHPLTSLNGQYMRL